MKGRAVSNPLYNAIKDAQLKNAAGGEEVTVVTGEAEGYGGTITAAGSSAWNLREIRKRRRSAVKP